MLHFFECARLLNLKRLAVSRETSDEHGVELLGLDDLANDVEFAEGNERGVAFGDLREGRRLLDQRFDAAEDIPRTGGLVNRERQRRIIIDNGIRRRRRSVEGDTRRHGRLGARRRLVRLDTRVIDSRKRVLTATRTIEITNELAAAVTGLFEFHQLTTGDDRAVGSDKGGQFFLLRSFHSIVLSVSVAPCATLNSIPIEYHGSTIRVKSGVPVNCCEHWT